MEDVMGLCLAYIIGTIPTAYVVSHVLGKDVRSTGSGNVGGMNVLRNVGILAGLVTVVGDTLKGMMAVAVCGHIAQSSWVKPVCLIASTVGHNWMPWLGFQGGKGLATSLGVLLMLLPGSIVPSLIVIAVLMMALKDSGMAVAVGVLLFPWLAWVVTGKDPLWLAVAVAWGVIVFSKHLGDVREYLSGRRRIL